jgi:hypothetical protein
VANGKVERLEIGLERVAERWDEELTVFKETLVLHGATYRTEFLFDTVPMRADVDITTVTYGDPRARFSPSRSFYYFRRTLPLGMPLDTAEGHRRGRVWWTTPVSIPMLAHTIQRSSNGVLTGDHHTYTWMSLTPAEVFTLRFGVQIASDDVMIGGLGLGWFLGRVCAKASVRRVRVVELRKELIDWLRPAIETAFPAVLTKQVEWVAGNAWDHIDCFGGETCNLIDIWPNYYDAPSDPILREIRRTRNPARLWCWGEDS